MTAREIIDIYKAKQFEDKKQIINGAVAAMAAQSPQLYKKLLRDAQHG